MSAKHFLDTNIFVYSFDEGAKKKREKARELIGETLSEATGIISTQVIQEFLSVALKKFSTPMTVEDAQLYLDTVLAPLCEVYPSLSLYQTTLRLQKETGYSFYDALIVAAALAGRCQVIYSEDLQDGRVVEGVRIVNPFP